MTLAAGVTAPDVRRKYACPISKHLRGGMRLERSTVVYLIDLARFDAFAFDLDGVVTNIWAGRAGNFGLVVGVDRIDDAEALRRRGADIVVTTLDQLELTRGAALEHR